MDGRVEIRQLEKISQQWAVGCCRRKFRCLASVLLTYTYWYFFCLLAS